MYSAHISQVEKARTYATERERVTINGLSASFRGNHNTYQISYDAGEWRCTCPSFPVRGYCSHVMALQRMVEDMLPRATVTAQST